MTCRKHVVWDESNLEDNEEYRRLHPVTMRITEPKTPYEYAEFDEEGNFDDYSEATDGNNKLEDQGSSTWDPQINALARELKEEFLKDVNKQVAPISSSGRPMLLATVTNGEELERQHEEKFKRMRRAVYADEGANYKALLGKKHDDDDDGEEEEEEEEEEK
ncbi:putative protein phosphatase inhibitor 2 (ipp-2) [Trypanosoma cruzi]|uniref:Protein phosphatase inhibitor 2 n=1 Tax=Trypanosoma cruzi TaxID=5693 RepID=A0A2V2WH63_TRYCR|nr:putative protein phosphatase inhibitor 2 (ipp-2) [Trypanosoma cruzi]PWV07958.1 putative protein phosphatase inhibitor 2 (ipp-2) [Trypanosoma cruzi]